MRRIIFLLVAMLFIGTQAFAQTTLNGTVTDGNGDPVPGASVRVKGYSDVGTITDLNGQYTISVPAEATTLIFSFVGMQTLEVEIAGQTEISASLDNEDIGIGEVIVVAYGTKTKREITGAVSSVDSEVIGNQIAVSPLRAIQGSAAGVNVITSGGQPGENPNIRIRGIGSVNASAEPLIVVDGVVFSGNINSISGDQIESINVLKDASSAALYGSRASNGVLLITTKGGKYGNKEATISVNTRYGISSPAVKNYDLVGASDYMKYTWEAIKNTELYDNGATATDAAQTATDNLVTHLGYNPYNVDNPVGTDGEIVSGANLLWDTDWLSALMREKAYYKDVSVGVNGGTEKLTYFFNGSYLDQDGSVIESKFKRFTGRVNITAKLRDWIEIGTNSSFSKSTQNYPNQAGSGYTNGMQWVNSLANIFPIYQRDENGDFIYNTDGTKRYDYGNYGGGQPVNASRPLFVGENAIASTQLNDINYDRTSLFSSSFMKITFLKNFTFRSNVGYESYLYDYYRYDHNEFGSAASVNGRVEQNRNNTTAITFTNSLSYNQKFGDHSVNIEAFSEVYKFKYDYLQAQATGYLPNVKVLSGSTSPEGIGGYYTEERLVSYMGRASYGYKQKYYFDASLRRDASTKFRDGNRWGLFYSVGGAWILSEESFMQGLSGTIDLLKLRASYGELGNNSNLTGSLTENRFPYLASYGTGWNNGTNTGILLGNITDLDLVWEKTGTYNIALDFAILNNRINGSIEYYNKKSIDLIFEKPLAPSIGDKVLLTNIGSMKNSGFEFIINTVNIHTNDIYWTTTFNIAANVNELLELPEKEITVGSKKWEVGKDIYNFFIEESAGVDPQTGDQLWYMDEIAVDGAGDPIIGDDGEFVKTGNIITTNSYSEATKYYQGSALPDFTGGFGTYFRYKGFDLNLLFNYSYGGKILDGTYQGLNNSGESPGYQMSADMANRWQQPGDITDIPRLSASNNDFNARSTRFLFDNNYLRLKALSVGYNLPIQLLSRVNVQKCRLYVQADNIWTYQSHKGIDPEQNYAGTTNNRSNMMKTITFGLNVEF